jgi:serine/threonine-protein kinase
VPSLVGKTLGRYEIVALLGAGGMGEVYRARDTQLSRPVAIKVISAKVTQSKKAIDRFEREAKTVAQLSHPNILEIHDFGREDGVVYAVTELLEGQDLRDRMRGSMLPLSKALEIGVAVANGLAAAHSKGIIHRDIKPENIFVTSTGQVKILDFGIAGLKGGAPLEDVDLEARTESLTLTGDVVGTMGYMSPEQIRGEKADPRSDIFALGCLLYEVLTGNRAFRGETSHDTMRAILNRDPDPIADYRPDVPAGIDIVVRRCLEKEPDERFESARDVAFALQATTDIGRSQNAVRIDQLRRLKRRRGFAGVAVTLTAAIVLVTLSYQKWRAPPLLPESKHLAVLPFSVVGDEPQLQESAAGLTEVVVSGLSLIEQGSRDAFWVVPIHEAERRGADTAADANRIFGATIALSGKLRRSGDKLRLDLDAIDAANGRSLRRLSIEDSVSNLSSFQEKPVLQICEMLEIPVNPDVRDRLASTATTMPEGFEAYLRALGILAATEEEGDLDRAIGLLETATMLDPLFASGRVALGQAYLRKHELSGNQEWIGRAEAQASQAAKDSRWPEAAYDLLADIQTAEGRMEATIESLEDATRAAPENAEAHLRLASAYQKLGRSEDSKRYFQRAIFLRPGYWPAHNMLALLYLRLGEYEAAAISYGEVIACAPRLTRGYNNLGGVLLYLERTEEARQMFERSIAIEPSRSALSNLGTLYFDEKRFADAVTMFERALEEDNSRYITWGNLAYAYKFGPAPEKAEASFRKAVELAEIARKTEPRDWWVLTDLAGYYAMLDDREKGLKLIDQVVAEEQQEPQLIAHIAETLEDLDDRERALVWVARAFDAGITPSRFENRPTLRELVADERYQHLVQENFDYS